MTSYLDYIDKELYDLVNECLCIEEDLYYLTKQYKEEVMPLFYAKIKKRNVVNY